MRTESEKKDLYNRVKKQMDSGIAMQKACDDAGIHITTWYSYKKQFANSKSSRKSEPKLSKLEVVAEKHGSKIYLLVGNRFEMLELIRELA